MQLVASNRPHRYRTSPSLPKALLDSADLKTVAGIL